MRQPGTRATLGSSTLPKIDPGSCELEMAGLGFGLAGVVCACANSTLGLLCGGIVASEECAAIAWLATGLTTDARSGAAISWACAWSIAAAVKTVDTTAQLIATHASRTRDI